MKAIDSKAGRSLPQVLLAFCLAICTGIVFANETDDKEKDFEVRRTVDCTKGQSIQDVLVQNRDDSKPLVVMIDGVCHQDVEIERDEVEFEGVDADAEIDGTVRLDEAREFGISTNLIVGRIEMGAAQAEFETEGEGTIIIRNGIFMNGHSQLTVENTQIMGRIDIEIHSSLIVGADSWVEGDIWLRLQSSLGFLPGALGVDGDIHMNWDSHTVMATDATVTGDINCDSESRVWGDISNVDTVGLDNFGVPCFGGP